MLTLTDDARAIVRTISESMDGDRAGLRITGDAGLNNEGFAIATALAPEPTDEALDLDGARVYLDAAASTLLTDQILDASVDEAGNVMFDLAPQR